MVNIVSGDFVNGTLKKKIKFIMKSVKITKYPLVIIDIHHTIEYAGKVDKSMLEFIKKLIKGKYAVILLSYETSQNEIKHHDDILLGQSDIFKKLPRIYTTKRAEGLIVKEIYEYIDKHAILYIDDRKLNRIDVRSAVGGKNVIARRYIANRPGNEDTIKKFTDIIKLMELLGKLHKE